MSRKPTPEERDRALDIVDDALQIAANLVGNKEFSFSPDSSEMISVRWFLEGFMRASSEVDRQTRIVIAKYRKRIKAERQTILDGEELRKHRALSAARKGKP